MKITIITPVFPYPKRGVFPGSERFIENLALYLKKLGNDIKIITTFWNGGNRYEIFNNIQILRILELKSIIGNYLGSFFFLHYITFGLNLFRKKNYNFYKNSDVILLNLPIGFTRFFNKRKIPLVSIFFHYVPRENKLGLLYYPIYHLLEKKQYRNSYVITISNSSKIDLVKYYNIKEESIKVIPIGVDTDNFNLTKSSIELRKIYGNSVLLYSGLMVPRKRVQILLKSMTYIIKEIPDIHLILTGEGLQLDYYKKLAKALGIQKNVSFLGFVRDEELSKLYASSDLFVFPSELEGFGQVILEAMASETPVICANKLPMSDLIEDGGITFKLNDPKDLSEKIINLLKNRHKLTDLKNNTIKIIKKYEWSNIAKTYQHYINQIIKLNEK